MLPDFVIVLSNFTLTEYISLSTNVNVIEPEDDNNLSAAESKFQFGIISIESLGKNIKIINISKSSIFIKFLFLLFF